MHGPEDMCLSHAVSLQEEDDHADLDADLQHDDDEDDEHGVWGYASPELHPRVVGVCFRRTPPHTLSSVPARGSKERL